MAIPMLFDPSTHSIGLNRELRAAKVKEQPDPPVRVDGVTFGVATMSENSPHGGEMHPDGDEILYLISGKVRVVLLDHADQDIELHPGDGMIVPQGVWHRVDILEPCQIVYVTPGPNNEFRPLDIART
ncbi:MAG: cupin domain-containing protein [Gammaproteobacteria bacterium]|nr:cupin domain-containing protein [Gammaproteobacteria bacterium]MDH3373520.1 cupin domain-containing protein [Gammaproteobacteria bacterium]MDH3553131.1 cupin domain-containing protein [Gammaproteobacteria bacterium]